MIKHNIWGNIMLNLCADKKDLSDVVYFYFSYPTHYIHLEEYLRASGRIHKLLPPHIENPDENFPIKFRKTMEQIIDALYLHLSSLKGRYL